jgi:magnesium transporter
MFEKRYAPVGSRPGTLVISESSPEPAIRIIYYTQSELLEFELPNTELLSGNITKLEQCIANPKGVTWVDVQGLGNGEVIRAIAKLFSLHDLTLADVVNVPQRPRTEVHNDYALNIGTMAKLDQSGIVDLEQLSVIWGKNYVITFQERSGDILDPVRNRIRKAKGPIRKSGCDYLAYALIDTTVDAYYPILEQLGETLEDLEDEIIVSPTEKSLQKVYKCKRELLQLRRSIWPQREAVSALTRDENPFVKKSTRIFFRDTYEHMIQVIDVLETYRELAASFMDVYLSSLSNKMNEVMKVLTIMGTIFIPLSFFAGVFGMNFEHMPELKLKWAYPAFWAFIVISACSMLLYFRRKGWIGSTKSIQATEE